MDFKTFYSLSNLSPDHVGFLISFHQQYSIRFCLTTTYGDDNRHTDGHTFAFIVEKTILRFSLNRKDYLQSPIISKSYNVK